MSVPQDFEVVFGQFCRGDPRNVLCQITLLRFSELLWLGKKSVAGWPIREGHNRGLKAGKCFPPPFCFPLASYRIRPYFWGRCLAPESMHESWTVVVACVVDDYILLVQFTLSEAVGGVSRSLSPPMLNETFTGCMAHTRHTRRSLLLLACRLAPKALDTEPNVPSGFVLKLSKVPTSFDVVVRLSTLSRLRPRERPMQLSH